MGQEILYGILIVLLLIGIWFYWAYYVYRISDARFKLKVTSKFSYDPAALTKDESKEYDTQIDSVSFTDPSRLKGNVMAVINFPLLPGITNPTHPQKPGVTVTYAINDESTMSHLDILTPCPTCLII